MIRRTTMLLAVLVAGTVSAQDDARQGLSPRDVVSLRTVRVVLPAGNGAVVFTRSEPRSLQDAAGTARARVYLWRAGEERLLLGADERPRDVQLHPSGTRVTFIARRAGEDAAQVWSVPLEGGEPERVTQVPRAVRGHRWHPDGAQLALTMLDEVPGERTRAVDAGFRQVVVDEDFVQSQLWLLAPGGALRRLTQVGSVFDFEWDSRGERIAARIAPRNTVDDGYMFAALHLVDVGRGRVTSLTDPVGKLGQFAWEPDGHRLAYVGAVDRTDPHAGSLFVVDVRDGSRRHCTPDLQAMVHHVAWVRDDPLRAGGLLLAVSHGARSAIEHVDLRDGVRARVFAREGFAFRSFAQSGDGYVVAGSTARHPDELCRVGRDGGVARLTDSNPWLADRGLGRQEVVRYAARDGTSVEGVLLYPLGYRPKERYPLVLVVHGGPESHYSDGWNTSYGRWGQMLSARGYFAFYQNYRASTGYGVAFAKANHGDVLGAEFDDLLDGVRHLVDRGLVDPARVGIGGGSYGGLMAAWGATRHSEHFAAAVSFVPVTDMPTKLYVSDTPFEGYHVHQGEVWPHRQRGFLIDRSPTTYAADCRTPLLLAGGDADTRVHPNQPFMLYRAVKFATKTPVRYVRYPGEGHGNRRNVYQYDYAVRALRWFDHYLRQGERRRAALPPIDIDLDGLDSGDR